MRMILSAAAPILALCLGACEDGAPEQGTTSVRAENPFDAQLKSMSEGGRNLGLYRAIRDSGNGCKRVDGGAFQENHKTMSMWTAHCSDSGDWAIFIAPNADVQVRKCRDAKALGLPECRPLPATVPAPAPKATKP